MWLEGDNSPIDNFARAPNDLEADYKSGGPGAKAMFWPP